jgi:transcriptional regulator with GAF, ATPase, and Fis domain
MSDRDLHQTRDRQATRQAEENARLLTVAREALDQQKASAEVLQVISSSAADTKPVFDKILESCQRLFEGRHVWINLVGEDGAVHLAAYKGADRDAFQSIYPLPLSRDSGSGTAILERRVAHYPDIEHGAGVPMHTRRGCRPIGVKSVLIAPLLWENRGVGAVFVGRGSVGEFSEQETRLLKTFADQAVIAIRNAHLFQELEDKNQQLQAKNAQLHAEIEAHQRARAIVHYLEDEIRAGHDFHDIVGRAPCFRLLLDQVALVGPTDSTVLILGETGTGKELIARAIHDRSGRRGGPLVRVNCAALPRELVESELFGHEKGAFTGATQQRRGRFELADGGTLFLDEIGELSLEAQAKLLRVLQEKEFERVGGTRTLRSDARLIAATNRDLHARVSGGEFRSDLFYRLNVFPLVVPPLRERPGDIPALIVRFLDKSSRKLGKAFEGVAPEFIERALAYPWPGNVRELENVIERAAILSRGPLLEPFGWSAAPEHSVSLLDTAAQATSSIKTLLDMEREHIQHALELSRWVIEGTHGAARALGVKPSTLRGRMRKLGIRKWR